MPSEDRTGVRNIEQCIVEGDEALSKGQLIEATTRFAQARLLIGQSGVKDSEELRHCLKSLAEIYRTREKIDDGIEIARALIKIDDTLEHRRDYVDLLHKLAAAYEKAGDRENAELSYGEALVEATELLPKDDPLIERLNSSCIDIFRRTFKSKKMRESDRSVVLAHLPLEKPEDESAIAAPAPMVASPETLQSGGGIAGRNGAAGHGKPGTPGVIGVSQMGSAAEDPVRTLQALLRSNTLSITVSLLLIGSLVQAALFGPLLQRGLKEPNMACKIEGKRFESADGRNAFFVVDGSDCVVKRPGFEGLCRYTLIEDRWLDLSTLLRGYLARTELWYRISNTAVIAPDNQLLPPVVAPDLAARNIGKARLLRVLAKKDEAGLTKPPWVFLCTRPGQEESIRFFRACSCSLVWLFVVITVLWSYSTHMMQQSFAIKTVGLVVAIGAVCTLAGWYLLAYSRY